MKTFATYFPFTLVAIICISGCQNSQPKNDEPAVGGPTLAREPAQSSGGTEIILPGGGSATPVSPDPNLGGGTGGAAAGKAKDMAKDAAAKASNTPVPTEETN